MQSKEQAKRQVWFKWIDKDILRRGYPIAHSEDMSVVTMRSGYSVIKQWVLFGMWQFVSEMEFNLG